MLAVWGLTPIGLGLAKSLLMNVGPPSQFSGSLPLLEKEDQIMGCEM